ncbi:Beta-N-acetylhexosaminidase [Hexamita inflata]|uniref:Beta-hexosaminidase n=1 Tax=Hexamita inflata TaxID=28002 RepID=A0AA86PYL5_9EUKA|nr:Beta-N-acetylhexosaminidase [Hexamita inflata]
MFAIILCAPQITPLPQHMTILNSTFMYVGPLQWSCKSNGVDCLGLIINQVDLYTKTMFAKGVPAPKSAQVTKLVITLLSTDVPQSPQEEFYNITVNSSSINVFAPDTYSLSRALSTVVQLIQEAPGDEYKKGLYSIMQVEIQDASAYSFRELMLDPSRHYLPVSTFKRQLNAMALTKFNVLHIHLTDTQSIAFAPETAPADKFQNSAFYNGGFFRLSKADMTEISSYANSLGIHIMIEYDMPGHATSWKKANAKLVANCPTHGFTSVNPINEDLFTYINAFLTDIIDAVYTKLEKTPLIHLGGDEVDHGCWNEDPEISSYMQKNGINTTLLWQQFHARVSQLVQKLSPNATRFYWQESYENQNEMKNAVVHAWYNVDVVAKATRNGYKVVRSFGWYLDQQKPGQQRYGIQDTWQDFYVVDVLEGVEKAFKDNVMGGGACMWGEKVTDGNIDEQIWPRAVAVAEALWSAPSVRTINSVLKNRFQAAACMLVAGGIDTGAFIPSKPCIGDKGLRL